MSLEKLASDIKEAANELELLGQFKFASVMDSVGKTIVAQAMDPAAPGMEAAVPPQVGAGMPVVPPQMPASFADSIGGAIQQQLNGGGQPAEMSGIPAVDPAMMEGGAGMEAAMAAPVPGGAPIAPEKAAQVTQTLRQLAMSTGDIKAMLLEGGMSIKEANDFISKIDKALGMAEGYVSGDPNATPKSKNNGVGKTSDEDAIASMEDAG